MERELDGYGGEAGPEVDIGGETIEEESEGGTERGGQGNKAGGRKRDENPKAENPEERAANKLLDKQIRKDEHEEVAQDPEAFIMKMAKNKNLDQPNAEIN